MIEQTGNAITFYAHYTESKLGKTGLTVTVDVYEGTTGTPIVNDGSATELAGGLYYYTLASGSVDTVGAYIAIFTTATTSVDQRDIPAIWTVGTAGIENLDASIGGVPTTAEFEARTLAAADYFDPATDTVASVTTVGSVTGAVGSVTGAVGSVTGAVGSVTGNVGGNVAGSVGSVTGAVGSVTGNVGGNVTGSVGSVAAGGITAASIATNAIDADALAADAVTEIQSGLATAANLATVAGYVDTEVASILAAVDTEVAAIKAKTDNLPASPAAVGSAMTLSAGAVTAAAVATGAIDADAIAADAGVEIAAAVWDRLLTGATHNIASSAGRRLRQLGDIIAGTVVDVTPGATTFDTSLAGYVDNHFNDQLLRFTSGNLTGQAKSIVSFVGVNGVITVDEGFTSAPANGDAFDIIPNHIHPISQIQAGLATQVSVNDIPTNAELAAALAAADDAVLAAIAALNNLSQAGAQAGAAAALAAYGAATAGDVGGLNDLSTADILAMAYEGAETLQAYLRLSRAALVGKATGGGTANIAFRDAADTKDRIAATVDGDGNRSAIVTDAS